MPLEFGDHGEREDDEGDGRPWSRPPTVFTACRFDPLGGEEVPGAVLRITGVLPPLDHKLDGWEARWRATLRREAEIVVAALDNLPGGTLDQVLCILLERKASLFRVPFGAPALPVRPPQGFRAVVDTTLRRFNVAGPEYPQTDEVVDQLWATLGKAADE